MTTSATAPPVVEASSPGSATQRAAMPCCCADSIAASSRCVFPAPAAPQSSKPVSPTSPAMNRGSKATSSAFRPERKFDRRGGSAGASSKISCSIVGFFALVASVNEGTVRSRTAPYSGRPTTLPVECRLVVRFAQMTQGDQQHRARRQGEQHAGKAEHLAESQQRENDGHRMQSDPVADQPGHQYVAFQQLSDAVDDQHGDKAWQAMPLQQCCQHAEDQAQTEADVRHEYQQAGEETDRQPELQTGDPERDHVVDCQ